MGGRGRDKKWPRAEQLIAFKCLPTKSIPAPKHNRHGFPKITPRAIWPLALAYYDGQCEVEPKHGALRCQFAAIAERGGFAVCAIHRRSEVTAVMHDSGAIEFRTGRLTEEEKGPHVRAPEEWDF